MRDLPEQIHVQWDQWEGTHLVAKTNPGDLAKAPYADYIRGDKALDNRMIVITEEDTRARELLQVFYDWIVYKKYGHLGYVPAEQEELRHQITVNLYKEICDLLRETE